MFRRKGNTYKSFPNLAAELARIVPRRAILDGEIVVLDSEGKPRFNDLLRRKGETYFAAFDLLWLDRTDFRSAPLIERKRVLRDLVPAQPSRLLYVQHQAAEGVRLFDAACRMDLEGLVAKLATGKYTPNRALGSRSRAQRTRRPKAVASCSKLGRRRRWERSGLKASVTNAVV